MQRDFLPWGYRQIACNLAFWSALPCRSTTHGWYPQLRLHTGRNDWLPSQGGHVSHKIKQSHQLRTAPTKLWWCKVDPEHFKLLLKSTSEVTKITSPSGSMPSKVWASFQTTMCVRQSTTILAYFTNIMQLPRSIFHVEISKNNRNKILMVVTGSKE